MESERGQSTIEWVGLVSLVCLLLGGLAAAGVRAPGTALADSVFEKILCGVSMADSCGDEPHLIAAYGTEVGKLANDHMPSIAFERGSRAVPVNFRRCRSTVCGDAPGHDFVRRTQRGLPVSAFVHVVDCRPGAATESEAEGADCAGQRAGNLYLQYWTYYADSATLRGVPIVGEAGYHADDWEGVQVRIRSDGGIDERASSTTATTTTGGRSTGPRTRASARSSRSSRRSAFAPRTAGARRPAGSSSPAAATPATPGASPRTSTASPAAARFT